MGYWMSDKSTAINMSLGNCMVTSDDIDVYEMEMESFNSTVHNLDEIDNHTSGI